MYFTYLTHLCTAAALRNQQPTKDAAVAAADAAASNGQALLLPATE